MLRSASSKLKEPTLTIDIRDADVGQAAAETNRRLRASNRQLDSESDKEKQPPFAILGEGHPITNRCITFAWAYGQTWISSGDFDNIQFPIITRGQVMEELKVTLEHLESTVVLRAVGPVDSTTAASLQEPLLRAVESSSGAVQLDLAQVSYLSSAGMRVFLLAAKALQKRGERLRLLNVPQQIHSLLNLAGFTSFIDVNS